MLHMLRPEDFAENLRLFAEGFASATPSDHPGAKEKSTKKTTQIYEIYTSSILYLDFFYTYILVYYIYT